MPLWLQNLLFLAGAALLLWLLRRTLRSERYHRAFARLRRDPLGIACAAVVALFLLIGLSDCLRLSRQETLLDYAFRRVPVEASYSAPLARTTYDEFSPQPLKGRHLLGTDLLGKDVLHQTLKGCRTALIIGGLTSLIYLPIGTLLGILAGYFRGKTDDAIQYLYSTLHSIPNILLLIALLMTLGRGLPHMALALSITAWITLCRLIRGETLRQSTRPYVEAARTLGQSHWKIITRHLLPNVMHLLLINAVLGFSGLVMTEAILSYLGVGAPVGTASWGAMIVSARTELSRDPVVWWSLAAASGALFLFILALNLLGDALRKAFDPRA